jgi:cytochrome oxidase Cu insertion factor (SCO1/SenC/PrrC family)
VPGMNSGLNVNDPTVVAAFRSALVHQGLLALLIFAVLAAVWLGVRARRRAHGGGPAGPPAPPEPPGRLLLLIGFGNLWLFDGLLQAQPKMALGLPSQVIEPAAISSPRWVQDVVNWTGTTWSYHPTEAAAAAVWIQIGLGIWLLAAPRGALSRLAGLAAVGWGLVVWIFGEAFGGLFSPGQSFLTGAPGAVLFYVTAGALIALPERAWRTPRLGRLLLGALGLFLLGMAALQAWPANGFWSGLSGGEPGPLAGMSLSMSLSPQPGFLYGWVTWFASLDESHGFAVNLVAVVVLAVTGLVFLTGRVRLIRPVLAGFTVFCLAVWVLIQDLGFLGGLGTDPNSMIPFALLAVSGYLALSRAEPWPEPDRARLPERALTVSGRTAAALGGAALIVLGAAPMAVAQASPDADLLLAQSVAGPSGPSGYRAPNFSLSGQSGRFITLSALRGHVVLLAFAETDCGSSCPPVAAEFRQAAQLLGPNAHRLTLVTIPAPGSSPAQPLETGAGLALTGSRAALERVWREYGVTRPTTQHNLTAYMIGPDGRVVRRFSDDPGPGTPATRSSFGIMFENTARQALTSS